MHGGYYNWCVSTSPALQVALIIYYMLLCTIVRGRLKGTATVYKAHVQSPCTLRGAFEARVYQYTLGYIRAPWQLWCPFQNCEYIIDN